MLKPSEIHRQLMSPLSIGARLVARASRSPFRHSTPNKSLATFDDNNNTAFV
jgi:hypothetical protein